MGTVLFIVLLLIGSLLAVGIVCIIAGLLAYSVSRAVMSGIKDAREQQ